MREPATATKLEKLNCIGTVCTFCLLSAYTYLETSPSNSTSRSYSLYGIFVPLTFAWWYFFGVPRLAALLGLAAFVDSEGESKLVRCEQNEGA